jgi:multiple sugar transport system permease protein
MRIRHGVRRVVSLTNLSAIAIVLFVVLPLYWLVVSSFKTPVDIGASPPQYFPNPISMSNYRSAFVHYDFGIYFENSVVVTVLATALVLALGALAGYALARLPIRGKLPLMVALLVISVFPEIAVVSPLYLLLHSIGWLDSYQALIIPYAAFNLPFAIWILRNYFLVIPREMEETARIDGASPLRAFWSVVLPQAKPGLFTAGVFTFTACWTEFLMALTFDNANRFRTIPVGIALFGSPNVIPYGTIFAASVVAIVPIGVLVFTFRKFVVSGLTSGAVKG